MSYDNVLEDDGLDGNVLEDQQTRTPPHGDGLRPRFYRPLEEGARPLTGDPAADRQRRELAAEIARRSPVGAAPIYRALLHHSAENIAAAIAAAVSAGVDPSSFPVYLVACQIPGLATKEVDPLVVSAQRSYEVRRDNYAAISRAMAGPEIPHNESGVPVMRAGHNPACYLCNAASGSTWVCEEHLRERAVPAGPAPHSLPSHIERAARAAWRVGHAGGFNCAQAGGGVTSGCMCESQSGVHAFRESLKRDADEATTAVAAPPIDVQECTGCRKGECSVHGDGSRHAEYTKDEALRRICGERPDAAPRPAPDGKAWSCPDCEFLATLGENVLWHRHKTGHGKAVLMDIPDPVKGRPDATPPKVTWNRLSHEKRVEPMECSDTMRLEAQCILRPGHIGNHDYEEPREVAAPPSDVAPLAAVKLLALKENWDSYGAPIISMIAVDAALQLRDVLAGEPSLVPTSSGGVQLEWHTHGFDVELEIEPNGRLAHPEDAPGGPWETYHRWATDEDGVSYETPWWGLCGKEGEDLSYNLACLTEPQAIAVRNGLNRDALDRLKGEGGPDA